MLIINGDYAMEKNSFKTNDARPSNFKVRISLTAKLLLFTVVSVVVMMILLVKVAAPKTSELEKTVVKDNLKTLAISNGKLLDEALTHYNGTLTENQYRDMFGDFKIDCLTTSQAYVVNYSGNIVYHRNASKIGTPADISAVQQIVATVTDVAEGTAKVATLPDTKVITYLYKGAENYMSYYVSPVDYSILIICVDVADVDDMISGYKTSLYTVAIPVCIICILLGLLLCYLIVKPLKQLVYVAHRLSNLEMADDEVNDRLVNRRDECGEIAQGISDFRNEIRNVIYELSEVSNAIHSNAVTVRNISSFITSASSENSITTDALSSSMQVTFSTTGSIDNSINNIQKKTGDIEVAAREGNALATQIIEKAVVLKSDTDQTINETHVIYNDIRSKSSSALEKAKSVDKIQALADAIRNISSQTSMLALNASIEAARAGELGRGFAVVADEIGMLASQSTDTVNDIGNIIIEIRDAMSEMTECLNFTIDFMENTVTHDLKAFSEVGNEYSNDAKIFDEHMSQINNLSKDLTRSIHDIVYAIDGINRTIGEATTGITDISSKTNEIVDSSIKSDKLLLGNENDANKLQTIMKKFRY